MKKTIIVLALLCTGIVTGCALLSNPTFDAVLQAVIDIAVGQLLGGKQIQASQLATDATALAQLAGGNTATVAQLETQADAVIAASSLNATDKAAVEVIIAAAVGLLQTESTKLSPTSSAGLQLVFTDIANAANIYGSSQGEKIQAIIQRKTQ